MPSVAIIGTRGYPSFYGGFETAVRQVAPFLVDEGWDVTVYGRPGAVKEDDPNRDPRVHTKTTWGLETKSLSTLSFGLSAALDAAKRKPDVALVMNVANGFWLPILRARGIPTLVNVDGIEWERAKWGRLAKSMFFSGALLTAKIATGLVYDSREVERRWNERFKRDGFRISYGGEPREEIEAVEGREIGSYALLVARFVPENTIAEFMDAVELIAHRHKVVLVGSTGYGGDFDKRAAELAGKYTNVEWLGHVSNDRLLFSLWQNAGAYFHGHTVGGTNPALVQAMALGAPTVAVDTPYNREVLGDAGMFVERNPRAIASGIHSLLTDSPKRKRLRQAAMEQARAYYTWELVCEQYEEALRSVMGGPN